VDLGLPVTVALPSVVLRLTPWPKRWLVYQMRDAPLSNSMVYAATFARRSSAEKALKAAQERTKFLSYRAVPQIVRLPIDKRLGHGAPPRDRTECPSIKSRVLHRYSSRHLERMRRVELPPAAWKAVALPLSYIRTVGPAGNDPACSRSSAGR
jgi:hypothetical protein